MNSIADRESRTWLDRSEWKLSPNIFQKINSQLGPLSTELFASHLSKQLPKFVSWKPDPLARVTDVFTLTWSDLPQKVCANSPWNLIGIVLSQVYNQSISKLILIAPSVESPSLVPSASTEVGQSTDPLSHVIRDDTVGVSELPPRHITPTSSQTSYPNYPCGPYQGKMPAATFQEQLQTWSPPHGGKRHQSVVIPPSVNGQAGVMNGIEIPFVAL